MPLLADYAITPDVFDVASYLTPGECEARLDNIRQVMLTEGLVRDLRGGVRLPRSRGQVKVFGSRHGVYINIDSCGRGGARAQRGIQRTCGRP